MPVQRNWFRATKLWPFVAVLAGAALIASASACNKREAAPKPTPAPAYQRGDRVVVEQAAATFFEGRVLSVEVGHLRVQAAGGNDPVSVATNDVYLLPPTPHELLANQLVVCVHDALWQPCRVRSSTATSVGLTGSTGARFTLAAEQVLVPSPLTALNLKRYFARQETEQDFSRRAQRAGDPRPEPSWKPSLHERLLVKVGGDWFTGYVRELDQESAEVSLSSAQRSANVPHSALSAEPPSSFVNELKHGDFVLLRPDSLSDPWLRREVHMVNDNEIVLTDASGALRSASPREVVPLRP